jgi:ketosteroid isomerase-like protein
MDWVHVNTVVEGKIIEMREYNDTAALLQAYNAPPSQ